MRRGRRVLIYFHASLVVRDGRAGWGWRTSRVVEGEVTCNAAVVPISRMIR